MRRLLILMIFSIVISGCAVEQRELSPSMQACISDLQAQNLKAGQDFVAGDVLVGFGDNVTEEQAIAMFDSVGLKFESQFPKMFSIFANYRPEIPGQEGHNIRQEIADEIVKKDREIHGAEFIVLWADSRVNKILIQFNMRATEDSAKEFLASFEDIEIESINYGSKVGTVKVPRGSEFEWICVLQENPLIEIAEVNTLARLT